MRTEGAGHTDDAGHRAYWYTLVVLMIYEFACGIDTGQTSVLVKPIEQTYGIGDTEFAAIAVSSVALGGTFVYYIGGVLADTYSRRNIILISASLWTLAALAVPFAAHPWQLFAARFAGGFAMSIGGASIFHMLVDSFSRDRRTIAISLFGVGVSIGQGFGLAFSGAILQLAQRIGPYTLSDGLVIRPWQLCFVFVAALGASVCALLLTLKEPTRLDVGAVRERPNVITSLRAFALYLRRHGWFWTAFLTANFSLLSLYTAIASWLPTLAGRVYHVGIVSAAAAVGTLMAATSIAGRLIGGSIAQALVNLGRGSRLPGIFAYFPGAALVFAVALPLVPSYVAALALTGTVLLLAGIVGAFQVNAIQDTVPNEVRGQIVGLFSFFGFVSTSIGTVGVAFVSDHFFGGGAGLRYAFSLLGAASCVAACVMFVCSAGPYLAARADLEESVALAAGGPATSVLREPRLAVDAG